MQNSPFKGFMYQDIYNTNKCSLQSNEKALSMSRLEIFNIFLLEL